MLTISTEKFITLLQSEGWDRVQEIKEVGVDNIDYFTRIDKKYCYLGKDCLGNTCFVKGFEREKKTSTHHYGYGRKISILKYLNQDISLTYTQEYYYDKNCPASFLVREIEKHKSFKASGFKILDKNNKEVKVFDLLKPELPNFGINRDFTDIFYNIQFNILNKGKSDADLYR